MEERSAVAFNDLIRVVASEANTHLVVIQATPFCNIDCSYCYLPGRDKHSPLSHESLVEIVNWLAEACHLAESVTVCWHAGEPLVLSADYYRTAFRTFERFEKLGTHVHHSIQTNAVLVTDAHCQVFREYAANVGVSLDGPQHLHDAYRRTRDGRGTWHAAVKGIRKLFEYELDVSAIAVVGPHSLHEPDAFYEAFATLGIEYVGINVQEIEGANLSSYIDEPQYLDAYKRFLKRVFYLSCSDGRVGFRELVHMLRAIRSGQFAQQSSEATPFHIVSFDHYGNFSTFSPELLGQTSPRYGPLNFGNVKHGPFADFQSSARFTAVHRDIRSGVEACRRTCAYFGVCGGGAPSNKLGEHGTFDVTETAYCRFARKAEYDVVLELFEENSKLIDMLSATAWWPTAARSSQGGRENAQHPMQAGTR